MVEMPWSAKSICVIGGLKSSARLQRPPLPNQSFTYSVDVSRVTTRALVTQDLYRLSMIVLELLPARILLDCRMCDTYFAYGTIYIDFRLK